MPCTRCKGRIVGKKQLARESIHLEQDILQETVGSQDQVCAAYGGVNRINFLQNGDFSVQPMTVSQERLEELNAQPDVVLHRHQAHGVPGGVQLRRPTWKSAPRC